MYLRKVEIDNIGPIDHLIIEPIIKNDNPTPLIIVGENGSGKSILLAHIVNSLIASKQVIFDDTEVEEGKVFKLRTPKYIKSGKNHSYSKIDFDSGLHLTEWQLRSSKKNFTGNYNYTPENPSWNQIPEEESSLFSENFHSQQDLVKDLHEKQCCLYFPVNRFEEPSWLNTQNLKSKASYTHLNHTKRNSNRNLICTSPLKQNRDWLLDLLFDRHVLDFKIENKSLIFNPDQSPISLPLFTGFEGQAARIYSEISIILKTALNKPDDAIRFGAGRRHNRLISIIKNEETWVPDLFQLSTGEVLLINLFLSIIRDFDLSNSYINQLSDIKGIVVIDEIDAHLHTIHQREILPKLLKLFPKVQFIITSHSPLFLLGMDECYGSDGFQVINMPDGKSISSNDFSEFQAAFDAFKETKQHRDAIDKILAQRSAPIVYVEGDYDIRYLNKAANLFKKEDLLSKIQLKDGGGFGNLDKIWRSYDNALAHLPECKIILLYDCDQERKSENKGKIYRSAMKIFKGNPIDKGIENLFPEEAISKAENFKPEFIDVFEASQKRERGIITDSPRVKKVNKDEKGNLCDWLCNNGTEDDFKNFLTVLEQIESILNSKN